VKRRIAILAAFGLLIATVNTTGASGSSPEAPRQAKRSYGAHTPADVRGSAPGRGAYSRGTLRSFAEAVRLDAAMGAPSADAAASALMTDRGRADKARANQGLNRSGKTAIAAGGESAAPAEPTTGFPGINRSNSGFIPPDVQIAAGPYQIVEAVNGRITVYNKNGSQAQTATPPAFYDSLGVVADDNIFDPQVAYDEYIGRFIVVYTTRNDTAARSFLLVAVSNTADATQGWRLSSFDAGFDGGTNTNNWCDYPHLGYSVDAIVISCNMFSHASSPSFQYVKVRVLSAAQVSTGAGCCFWWDFWNLREGFLGISPVFTVQPAAMHNAITADGAFLAAAEGRGGSGSNLHVYRIPNTAECCDGDTTGPGLDESQRGVGSYSSPPDAEQPGSVAAIDTGDTRLQYAVFSWPRMFVGQNTADGSDSTVSFTEFTISNYPTTTLVNDWIIGAGGMNRYYAAADSRVAEDKSMVYSASNTSTNAGSRWVEIPRSTTCTACFTGEFVQRSGASTYLATDGIGRNRWGDYLDASRDPNAVGIWIGGEFVESQNQWGTEISLTRQAIDTSAPSTSATRSPAANPAGWNNTAVSVLLNAGDTGVAGVRRITYSASGANPIGTTVVNGSNASVPINAEGVTNVFYAATDNWGNVESTKVITVRKDTVAPSTPTVTKPTSARPQVQRSTSVPVAWSGGSDTNSGFANYDVQSQSTPWNGAIGAYVPWLSGTTLTSSTWAGTLGSTHCFRAVARDVAGNVSGVSGVKCAAVPLDDRSLNVASGTWTRSTGTGYFRNTFTSSTTKGSTLSRSGVQAKGLTLLATTCPTCGSVNVLWNGTSLGVFPLTSTVTTKQVLVPLGAFATRETGTIVIRVTTSGKKVEIDGLGVRAF
jgi:hypothetical protein